MKLFETLSARLAARGIRGQLYIVGGSAMIVGYGRERTTRDVDARIEYAKDEVLAAAEEIKACPTARRQRLAYRPDRVHLGEHPDAEIVRQRRATWQNRLCSGHRPPHLRYQSRNTGV